VFVWQRFVAHEGFWVGGALHVMLE